MFGICFNTNIWFVNPMLMHSHGLTLSYAF